MVGKTAYNLTNQCIKCKNQMQIALTEFDEWQAECMVCTYKYPKQFETLQQANNAGFIISNFVNFTKGQSDK